MFKHCVILAGGKSSRMGSDKTKLPFGEFETLVDFEVSKFDKIFQNIYISSKNHKFSDKFKTIEDKFENFSPMGALWQILSNFKDEYIFIVPADMPFISIQTINLLYENLQNSDIINPRDDEFTHSLCGFFHSKVASIAKELYENNIHKIGFLRQKCNAKTLYFKNNNEFFNINTPQDYQKAKEFLLQI
ncbi:putative molybdopterin-guanine dinucleotide biosynthesis protein [Campylobacter sputorum subsp. bubulus]|uniref:Probable molybdenum cofactor guanylyltransferase n=1 Tax=Campylobacter sputorum subsp. sputorum TaxID=32024 RepID=A0A381DIR8_9BACT|nr:molybdenum cofactor guanylyltransferase [Campylobacter sputorum]ASM35623.1 molybdenum cofactor guanylyltransferase protein A [Campylobacter sputorum aubsp. sputorum RM3237]KAB0582647.1 molybdenum cofactor guanylyltransferase [Campylobacter sputorum subsp. sputorum]QEL05814.1 molybdenum cofactor guanylyltransferase protein A [Campylobacter sputorum subsp. sputorum]SUX08022.1 putative molybdopterin-guanine dinucleotide biosynthesis protein [Campylobacter sputorum subsp. bubulus]SUX10592.1 put